MTKQPFAQADTTDVAWTLPENQIWNIPEGPEVRFEIETRGPWGIVSKMRGLAVNREGKVYGMRSLDKPQESGYQMEGRVKVGGKSFRAFTASQLFQRQDGSLCDVAILYVCNAQETGK